MTNPPEEGQQPAEDPQPGYWEQQSQQAPYGQAGYGYPPAQQPPMQYAPDHPKATTVLVLGVLGLVVCGLVAPFAWVMGKQTVNEIDASQGRLGGRGAANAGYILGIIGTVFLGFALLTVVAMLGLFGMAAVSTGY
jgi:hypothetical protein